MRGLSFTKRLTKLYFLFNTWWVWSPVREASFHNVCSSQIYVGILQNNASIFSAKFHLKRNHACLFGDCNAGVSASEAEELKYALMTRLDLHKITAKSLKEELPDTIYSGMHGKKITNFRTFSSYTANKAFRESCHVEAVYHVKAGYGSLTGTHRKL